MRYIKPSIGNLIYGVDDHNKNYLGDVVEQDISNCLKSHKIDVKHISTVVSPTNVVINYQLKEAVSIREVKNRTLDLSVCVGCDVKITQQNTNSGCFSISVRRRDRLFVSLRKVIESEEYKYSKNVINIAAGIDENANAFCFDLAQAPHLLIDGTTGAGKTVFLDDIILSILFQYSPRDVKLVLIDTAEKDFKVYENLPHLLCPVIKSKVNAEIALRTIRNIMNNRFNSFADAHVKTIDKYNEQMNSPMPRIVVIIDKYLDVSQDIPESFESSIFEIARKGRAAGIHLIINTQTAKSNVLSKDMIANINYRAAFSVVDWHESKAVLDQTGAQRLLGNGDMLFRKMIEGETTHLQAAFVSLSEIENVVKEVILKNTPVKSLVEKKIEKSAVSIKPKDKEWIPVNYVPVPDEPGTKPVIILVDDSIELTPDQEYEKKILETVSGWSYVTVLAIARSMSVGFAEATRIMKYLEKKNLVSSYVFLRGRPVSHENVEQELSRLEFLVNAIPDKDDSSD